MNASDEKSLDPYRSLMLMTEIANEEPVSQRELAQRLGIALGLVNSYLKNLATKGFVRIKSFPRNRYAYLLTPQGIAEKSRLAYEHLSYFTNLFTIARQDYSDLFRSLKAGGVKRVAFCGVDEVAEIAYLSLRETGLELALVMDTEPGTRDFFGLPVFTLGEVPLDREMPVIITSLKRGNGLRQQVLGLGIAPRQLFAVGIDAALVENEELSG